MSNFVIEIKAPEIVAVMEKLAAAMSGKSIASSQISPVSANPTPAQAVQNLTPAPVMTAPPIAPRPTMPTAPIASPAPVPAATPAGNAPAPIAPINPAPVASAPTYQQDDLARAAAQLMDAGRQQDLVNLIAGFGVPSLAQLPHEQYGNFAMALKQMGAKL